MKNDRNSTELSEIVQINANGDLDQRELKALTERVESETQKIANLQLSDYRVFVTAKQSQISQKYNVKIIASAMGKKYVACGHSNGEVVLSEIYASAHEKLQRKMSGSQDAYVDSRRRSYK